MWDMKENGLEKGKGLFKVYSRVVLDLVISKSFCFLVVVFLYIEVWGFLEEGLWVGFRFIVVLVVWVLVFFFSFYFCIGCCCLGEVFR